MLSFDGGFLRAKALEVRRIALEMAVKAGKGHIPPAFSWVDLAVVLFYGNILDVDPKNPNYANRDRFILSKGHACLTLYVILADLGFFSEEHLWTFAKPEGILPGHPDTEIPGIEASTGSLGHGLGIAAGNALASRLDGRNWGSYVLLGDAECHEGSIWEAMMFAGQQKLGKLVAIIDRNGLGATNFTEAYASLEPLDKRVRSFGWDVVELDGHDYRQIYDCLQSAKSRGAVDKPLCVIARTIKGRGVRYMENSKYWHHQMPKDHQIEEARQLLGDGDV